MTHRRNKRFTLGALCLATVLFGCEGADRASLPDAPPFVFRSLELRQKRPNGQRDWDLTSPEARYEFSRRLVRASRPEGTLYRDGQETFRISANRATVVNDGELVLLEGNVNLQQLQGQKVLIKGDRLRWTPAASLLVMEQRPEAIDPMSRIKASKARLHQLTEDLTLLGNVQLERWTEPQGQRAGRHADVVVRSGEAEWNLADGDLQARGPVLGQRRGEGHKTLQQLHAERLKGNTVEGLIDLIGPVRVLAPDREGQLEAATTTWDFAKDALISRKPFNATMKESRLQGDGFRIDMGQTTVTVLSACQMKQPGETLNANQCSWDWTSNRVSARGNVVVERPSNQQITRSDRLDGTVGDKGTVIFSSPGGTVQSELNIQEEQERPLGQAKRRSSPVSF